MYINCPVCCGSKVVLNQHMTYVVCENCTGKGQLFAHTHQNDGESIAMTNAVETDAVETENILPARKRGRPKNS